MTKFEEMCQSRTKCVKAGSDYRERSYDNLGKLINGFAAYCQIPGDCVSFLPLDKEPEEGKIYTPVGATYFDNTDYYWHVGLVVTLRESPNVWPQTRILVELALREQAGKIMVKRGKDDKPREIDISNARQCTDLYESIVMRVNQYFASDPQNLPDDTMVRKIGFDTAGAEDSA